MLDCFGYQTNEVVLFAREFPMVFLEHHWSLRARNISSISDSWKRTLSHFLIAPQTSRSPPSSSALHQIHLGPLLLLLLLLQLFCQLRAHYLRREGRRENHQQQQQRNQNIRADFDNNSAATRSLLQLSKFFIFWAAVDLILWRECFWKDCSNLWRSLKRRSKWYWCF